jgi:hypothetical protein
MLRCSSGLLDILMRYRLVKETPQRKEAEAESDQIDARIDHLPCDEAHDGEGDE